MDSAFQRSEVNVFWRCAGNLREARRNGASPDEIAAHIDEIEVIEKYTESDALRARCRAALSEGAAAVATAG